jgi:hypothetical protein
MTVSDLITELGKYNPESFVEAQVKGCRDSVDSIECRGLIVVLYT